MVDAAMKFRMTRISRKQTLGVVALTSSPVVLLLVLWSAIDTLDVEWVPVANKSFKQLMCTSDNYWVWQGILLGYLGCFGLFGLFVAFKARKMSRGLSETRLINFCLISSAVIAAIVIPLVYGLEDSPEAVIILATIGGGAAITLIWALLFGEKFYFIARGKNPSREDISRPSTSSSNYSGSTGMTNNATSSTVHD